ncbi:MAG: DUF1428 family protein [Bdellovibrionaceae bacterium]|nr:DUF1428 family protein [Pseudobdellovibrionaceae bacterium]
MLSLFPVVSHSLGISVYTSLYFYRVPKKNIEAFLKVQKQSAEIYKKNGAIEDWTFGPENLNAKYGCISFPEEILISADEELFFSLSIFKSKNDHDQIMALVDKDPEIERLYNQVRHLIDLSKVVRGEFNRLV